MTKEKQSDVLKDVVKIVSGQTGTAEHLHEEYWQPTSPDQTNPIKKIVARRMRKPDISFTIGV